MPGPQLSVIYPAYNEPENLRPTVEQSVQALTDLGVSFEIIVVDDGSTDRTPHIADGLGREFPPVRVIHNPRNLGQGRSIQAGFAAAEGELLIHNGVDYCFHLDDLRSMLPLIADADIVVAERTSYPGYTPFRRFMSSANLLLLHTLFGTRLQDYNFVQLYRRDVWDTLPSRARYAALLTAEKLIRAHDHGLRIRAVPVEYYERTSGKQTGGVANKNVLTLALVSLWDVLSFWVRYRFFEVPTASNH